MPIYEYHCHSCGTRVEVLVRSRASSPKCPDCGSVLTDKLFSVPAALSKSPQRPAGLTCCGRDERCGAPACSEGGGCRHD